jgi:hypothetical protein
VIYITAVGARWLGISSEMFDVDALIVMIIMTLAICVSGYLGTTPSGQEKELRRSFGLEN